MRDVARYPNRESWRLTMQWSLTRLPLGMSRAKRSRELNRLREMKHIEASGNDPRTAYHKAFLICFAILSPGFPTCTRAALPQFWA